MGAGAIREKLLFLLYFFSANLLVIVLQICYVRTLEYLGGLTFKYGGPTFEWGGPIFKKECSQKYAHPPI